MIYKLTGDVYTSSRLGTELSFSLKSMNKVIVLLLSFSSRCVSCSYCSITKDLTEDFLLSECSEGSGLDAFGSIPFSLS